jgi:hypothetical protein
MPEMVRLGFELLAVRSAEVCVPAAMFAHHTSLSSVERYSLYVSAFWDGSEATVIDELVSALTWAFLGVYG